MSHFCTIICRAKWYHWLLLQLDNFNYFICIWNSTTHHTENITCNQWNLFWNFWLCLKAKKVFQNMIEILLRNYSLKEVSICEFSFHIICSWFCNCVLYILLLFLTPSSIFEEWVDISLVSLFSFHYFVKPQLKKMWSCTGKCFQSLIFL